MVASALVGAGVLLVVAGLVWLFGPYGLLGCGVVLVTLGLLLPVRERRGEPSDPAAPQA
jgi:hypothetical protein